MRASCQFLEDRGRLIFASSRLTRLPCACVFQAYLAHKGTGSPLPSLAAIREMREESLKALLEEELLELFFVKLGLRRARPLALPAPPLLCLPAPEDPARALAAAQAASLATALVPLPQPSLLCPAAPAQSASTSTGHMIWVAAWFLLFLTGLPACMVCLGLEPEEDGGLDCPLPSPPLDTLPCMPCPRDLLSVVLMSSLCLCPLACGLCRCPAGCC